MNEIAVPDAFQFDPKDILVIEKRMTVYHNIEPVYDLMGSVGYCKNPTEYEFYARFIILNPEIDVLYECRRLEEFGIYVTYVNVYDNYSRLEYEAEFRFYPRFLDDTVEHKSIDL